MSMVIFFVDQNHKNKSLSEILDIKKLMNVDKAIESANGLPNECYTNEQYLEYERDKIFCDKWTVIGVASSIPIIGHENRFLLLGVQFFILGDKKNKISHRGQALKKLMDKLNKT